MSRKKRNMLKRRQGAFMRMLSLSVPVAGAAMLAPAISHAATTGTVTGVVTAARMGANNQPAVDAQGNLAPGAPQRGANVRLVPIGGGAARSTVTGPDGRYTFAGVQPGSYNVVVSLVTFEDATNRVEVSQDLTSTTNFVLTQRAVEVEAEIEIETVRPTQTTTTTEISARTEQLTKANAYNLYQFPGLIFGTPGITPDPEGYTHIRGGDTDQVGFQIDGIDITDPQTNTFGTNLVTVGLKNANVYTGGANASYGGKTAGFINQVTQNGRDLRGGVFEYTGGPGYGNNYQGTNIQYGNIFGKVDFYGAFIGFRNDFPDNTTIQSLNDSADGLFKVNYYADANNTLTGYYSGGFEQYDFYQPREEYPEVADAQVKFEPDNYLATKTGEYQQDHNTQGNRITYLQWRRNFSPTSFATFRNYRFYTFVNFHLENTFLQFQRRNSTQIGNQLDYENQISPQYKLQLGLHHIRNSSGNFEIVSGFGSAAEWNDTQPASADGDPVFAQSGYVHRISRAKPTQVATYINNQFRLFNNQLTVDAGLRYARQRMDRVKFEDYTNSYTDPRLGITINPARNTVYRGSLYWNTQFPDSWRTEVLFPADLGIQTARVPGDPNLPLTDPANAGSQYARLNGLFRQDNRLGTIKSEGYDLGVEQGFNFRQGFLSGNYQAILTGYRRRQWDMLQLDRTSFEGGFPGAPPTSYINGGTGHASGVEFQLNKRRIRASDLNGFISYTNQVARTSGGGSTALFPFFVYYVSDPFLSDEEYRQLNRREFAPDYDQRHTVAVVANKRLHRNFETTLILDAGSGFPFAGGAPNDPGSFGSASAQYGSVLRGDADFAQVPVILPNGRTLQPQNPVVGRSGWHYKISINNNFYLNDNSWLFLNVDNVFNRKFVTNFGTQSNAGTIYYNEPSPEFPQGSIYYGPTTVVTPIFLSFGIRTRF